MFPTMHSRFLLICCVIYSVIWLSSAHPYCGPYERPVECIDQCQTCEYKNGGCAQPAVCIEGCDCIPGFLRNKQNQCIPAAFCPVVCGPNSKPSDCVSLCEPTCRERKARFCPQSCTKGCLCDEGFLKDDRGNCIPENECPIACGPNSKPSDCVFCEPTCRNPKPKICPQSCTKGCACDDGFLKHDNGNCIPEYKCPSPPRQCPPGEIPVDCIDRCQRCEYKNGNCSQILICTPGCNCLPGFLRDSTNKCIPADFCPGAGPGPGPAQQCPAGEIPVECIDRCQRCEYKNGNCVQSQVCTPGCNCVPGFLRDKTNKCIPANFCPDQCKSDEQYYSDIPDCKNTCENYNNPGAICPQYFAARPGCFCAIGLVKRKDGLCVKPENCFPPGPPPHCPAGEIPVECIDRCQRCEYKNSNCSQILLCTPGCNCLPGFLRDSTNKCIPADFCPTPGPAPAQQCGQYERPVECIDLCQTCEYKNGGCKQPAVCIPGCDCIPGFFRNKQKQCIPAAFCPGPPQQCPAGEIPVECIDRCQRCEYKNGNCSQIQVCTPGCNCVPGFLRDSTNKCIPADFCPGNPCLQEKDSGPCYGYFPRFYYNKKTGQCEKFIYGGCEGNSNNFEYKELCEAVCKGPGPTQQCGQYERPVECIDQCQTCEHRNGGVCAKAAVCIPGCDCIPGFFRNKQKQCIPAAFCPGTGPGPAQQCPPYEYPVECIDKCQTCEYKNGHCIQTAECTPGCNCVPGFLRDKTKMCIPAFRCP